MSCVAKSWVLKQSSNSGRQFKTQKELSERIILFFRKILRFMKPDIAYVYVSTFTILRDVEFGGYRYGVAECVNVQNCLGAKAWGIL